MAKVQTSTPVTVNCTTELNDANKEGTNMKNIATAETTITIDQLMASNHDGIIAKLSEIAKRRMADGHFPEEVILEGIKLAPYEGATNLVFDKDEPKEGVFYQEGPVVMAYGKNPLKGKLPYKLTVHIRRIRKPVEISDEVMRAKLARYLDAPMRGMDEMIQAICHAVSLEGKNFGVVRVNLFKSVREALDVPEWMKDKMTIGGPGVMPDGKTLVPNRGVFAHAVTTDEDGAKHYFRVGLPSLDWGYAVKPFIFGENPKQEAES